MVISTLAWFLALFWTNRGENLISLPVPVMMKSWGFRTGLNPQTETTGGFLSRKELANLTNSLLRMICSCCFTVIFSAPVNVTFDAGMPLQASLLKSA